MASNRHLGRIIVLQSLYEYTFREECGETGVDANEIISRNISRYKASLDDKSFVDSLAHGVISEAAKLDKKIQPVAPEWPLNQIARIDHIVLRIGTYELLHHDKVPPKVVINEAVELAKAFGGESSSRFVNGVLGTLLRKLHPEKAAEAETPKKATKPKKASK